METVVTAVLKPDWPPRHVNHVSTRPFIMQHGGENLTKWRLRSGIQSKHQKRSNDSRSFTDGYVSNVIRMRLETNDIPMTVGSWENAYVRVSISTLQQFERHVRFVRRLGSGSNVKAVYIASKPPAIVVATFSQR